MKRSSSIVYVRNRFQTEKIASFLNELGVPAAPYHAKMSYESRTKNQKQWQENRILCIVATNAFGMGIDKKDVRNVIHWAPPSSIEEFYQESGRAGRDGNPSNATLCFNDADVENIRKNQNEYLPCLETMEKILSKLYNYYRVPYHKGRGTSFPFDISVFCKTFSLPLRETNKTLHYLTLLNIIMVNRGVRRQPRVHTSHSTSFLRNITEKESRYSRVLDILIRNCPGILTDFVTFNQILLAKKCGMEIEEWNHCLFKAVSTQNNTVCSCIKLTTNSIFARQSKKK